MDSLKKLIESLKSGDKNKSFVNLVILILVGILLVVLSNSFKSTSSQASNLKKNEDVKSVAVGSTAESITREYEQAKKLELKNLLENTAGVGRVEAAVYCESGEELVPAENVNSSTSVTNEKEQEGGTRVINQQTSGSTVVMSSQGGENSALILKKFNPRVTGVCIVAEGAEEKVTELRIKLAVMKFFKISEDQITVLPMKK